MRKAKDIQTEHHVASTVRIPPVRWLESPKEDTCFIRVNGFFNP